ncbi:macrophage migration inhibitory factor isoform X1 [Herpailurus yagouaroundi]|uniref:macrophage migration inhibitory factor isoform X1 n=1 Tax=Herpailurus yagouaroundi TaxID=1608482 RepID=UPI001AD78EB0|nr:macrophage migration inhibitory factor isoform X1 [Puma yagouaroundi]
MPMFVVNTNVPRASVPDGLLSELTQQLAQATGKPAQDLHQLLRHERGQRGLEQLHLRLRAALALPALHQGPAARSIVPASPPATPTSRSGEINGLEAAAASGFLGLRRSGCRAGTVTGEPRAGGVPSRNLLLESFCLALAVLCPQQKPQS